MTTTRFVRLTDIPVREAWPDEARNFTPWLFDNISFLSDTLGIELKAIATEAAVDSFLDGQVVWKSRSTSSPRTPEQVIASSSRTSSSTQIAAYGRLAADPCAIEIRTGTPMTAARMAVPVECRLRRRL